MTEERMLQLELQGVLPPWLISGVRIPDPDEIAPAPAVGEVVSFQIFHERGLTFPVGGFLRSLLHHYGLELQHLSPNGVLHVSIFTTLCEAFLGIEADLVLWFYLFACRNLSASGGRVGSAGFQLRPGRAAEYIDVPLRSSNKGWHDF